MAAGATWIALCLYAEEAGYALLCFSLAHVWILGSDADEDLTPPKKHKTPHFALRLMFEPAPRIFKFRIARMITSTAPAW
jgi:hypothetical protein